MADGEKITVLFVNPTSDLGGDMQSLCNLIESLRCEIKPIVLLKDRGSQAYNYFNSRGIECIEHPFLGCFELSFWHRFRNILLHPWRARLVKWLRYDVSCLFYVKKQLSGRKIDLIHTNSFRVRIGFLLSKAMHVPHVWHVREYVYYWGYRDVYMGLKWHKKLINRADARIFVSKFCLQVWKLKLDNTWVLWDAVRSINDCCFEKEKQPYILFCSYWVNEAKGASKAVEAFGKSGLFTDSNKLKSTIRLKIIGECSDDYKKELQALSEKYNCLDYIDFLPLQKDVRLYFANAMAFVQPSINEGLGRTTAEAMFYGCPVIACASGGTMELIKNRETGYLFNTIEECAELIKEVCATNQEKVIYRAQKFAKQNLSIENYGRKIMEVYNSVLEMNTHQQFAIGL